MFIFYSINAQGTNGEVFFVISEANASSDSLAPSSSSASTPLQRERNRLTLRSYINTLLSTPEIASSPVLRSFLTMNPITLNEEERTDARRREELDRIREEGKTQFEKEVSDRVDKLRNAAKDLKGDLMGPGRMNLGFLNAIREG